MSSAPFADVNLLVEEILREAASKYPLRQKPTIVWKRLRVSAGIAYYQTSSIALSSLILDSPEKLRQTLLHEYAHLLAFERHGRKAANHGPYWQQAMRDLGLQPVVRHSYVCLRNQPRQRVEYVCKRCGQSLIRTRRLPTKRKYVHRSCGGGLVLAGIHRL